MEPYICGGYAMEFITTKKGSTIFSALDIGQCLVRRDFTEVPIPNKVVEWAEELSRRDDEQ